MARFVAELNGLAQVWGDVIWLVLWQSTLLIAVIAGTTAIALRRSPPALRFWVWQILAIKLLLMPFWIVAVQSPWPASEQTFDDVESAPLVASDAEVMPTPEEPGSAE